MSTDDDTRVMPTEPVLRTVGDRQVLDGPPPIDLLPDLGLAEVAARALAEGSLEAVGPALVALLEDAPAEVRAELFALIAAVPGTPPADER